jgi:predicted DNA binding CopG/RHH family protein
MARKSTERVAFKSEGEEADWFATPQRRQQTQREFERALRGGAVTRLDGAKLQRTDAKVLAELMEQAKAKATKAISIRLPIADIELAKSIAEAKGVGYQSVLKQAIRKGLKRAG